MGDQEAARNAYLYQVKNRRDFRQSLKKSESVEKKDYSEKGGEEKVGIVG